MKKSKTILKKQKSLDSSNSVGMSENTIDENKSAFHEKSSTYELMIMRGLQLAQLVLSICNFVFGQLFDIFKSYLSIFLICIFLSFSLQRLKKKIIQVLDDLITYKYYKNTEEEKWIDNLQYNYTSYFIYSFNFWMDNLKLYRTMNSQLITLLILLKNFIVRIVKGLKMIFNKKVRLVDIKDIVVNPYIFLTNAVSNIYYKITSDHLTISQVCMLYFIFTYFSYLTNIIQITVFILIDFIARLLIDFILMLMRKFNYNISEKCKENTMNSIISMQIVLGIVLIILVGGIFGSIAIISDIRVGVLRVRSYFIEYISGGYGLQLRNQVEEYLNDSFKGFLNKYSNNQSFILNLDNPDLNLNSTFNKTVSNNIDKISYGWADTSFNDQDLQNFWVNNEESPAIYQARHMMSMFSGSHSECSKRSFLNYPQCIYQSFSQIFAIKKLIELYKVHYNKVIEAWNNFGKVIITTVFLKSFMYIKSSISAFSDAIFFIILQYYCVKDFPKYATAKLLSQRWFKSQDIDKQCEEIMKSVDATIFSPIKLFYCTFILTVIFTDFLEGDFKYCLSILAAILNILQTVNWLPMVIT